MIVVVVVVTVVGQVKRIAEISKAPETIGVDLGSVIVRAFRPAIL
jgi:hypothetical protein